MNQREQDGLALGAGEHVLEQLAHMIESELGLSFPPARRRDLQAALCRITGSPGGAQASASLEKLLKTPWDKATAELCALHLTVGETYFFREPRAFELVCDYARKRLAEGHGLHRPLRIWSAGCSTGEEPYSIAMALRQALPAMGPRDLSILATDLNGRHLQFAQEGVYRQWSFRATNPALQARHFSEQEDGRFRINEDIRQSVRFARLNLAAPEFPPTATGTFDIIFCRNVLMYFSRRQAARVIARFRDSLVEGGWLIVNPSEASAELFTGFTRLCFPDAIYFQKCGISRTLNTDAGPPAARASEPAAAPRPSRPRERLLEVEEALTRRRSAPAADPLTAEFFHARALRAMESGDFQSAARDLKGALYLKPDFILAHYLMGVLHSAQEKHSAAIRQFKTAAELLSAMKESEVVPGSDGLPVAYLLQSVRANLDRWRA